MPNALFVKLAIWLAWFIVLVGAITLGIVVLIGLLPGDANYDAPRPALHGPDPGRAMKWL